MLLQPLLKNGPPGFDTVAVRDPYPHLFGSPIPGGEPTHRAPPVMSARRCNGMEEEPYPTTYRSSETVQASSWNCLKGASDRDQYHSVSLQTVDGVLCVHHEGSGSRSSIIGSFRLGSARQNQVASVRQARRTVSQAVLNHSGRGLHWSKSMIRRSCIENYRQERIAEFISAVQHLTIGPIFVPFSIVEMKSIGSCSPFWRRA